MLTVAVLALLFGICLLIASGTWLLLRLATAETGVAWATPG
ncbi:MAG TPA: hypothetical protein VHV74_25590 [Pseudonocardiaceae bacterium]|jgi:hypothetical protein|nr:hypothetical protein [Pseudonocardiaceae bacterium]